MAITPQPTRVDVPKPPSQPQPLPKVPNARSPVERAAARAAPERHHPTLPAETALALFYNGHRIALDGDPQEKWISMGRLGDGTAIHQMPMTDEMVDEIKAGQYYLIEDQGAYIVPPPPESSSGGPAAAPTNVDVPLVTAAGAVASCTTGNWTGEPTSYAYAWMSDGTTAIGTNAANYSMGPADTGHQIGCIVSATNAQGTTAAPLSNTVVGP